MTDPVLFVAGILRALVELALLFLAGQGALALLAGGQRHNNAIYAFFRLATRPALKLVRLIAPRQIIDRHLPFVAFFLLFWCWIGLAWFRLSYCEAHGLQCFR